LWEKKRRAKRIGHNDLGSWGSKVGRDRERGRQREMHALGQSTELEGGNVKESNM